MAFDYKHPTYRAARAVAIDRSGGVCQFWWPQGRD